MIVFHEKSLLSKKVETGVAIVHRHKGEPKNIVS
jgi:hypothetical protein